MRRDTVFHLSSFHSHRGVVVMRRISASELYDLKNGSDVIRRNRFHVSAISQAGGSSSMYTKHTSEQGPTSGMPALLAKVPIPCLFATSSSSLITKTAYSHGDIKSRWTIRTARLIRDGKDLPSNSGYIPNIPVFEREWVMRSGPLGGFSNTDYCQPSRIGVIKWVFAGSIPTLALRLRIYSLYFIYSTNGQ